MPRRTFLDSNVLIAAHRGDHAALRIIAEPDRFFIGSPFLELELLPKSIYYRNATEAEFYRNYLSNVRLWINDVATTVRIATEEASRAGLSAMDALLIAAAHLGGADEFWTLEDCDKPIFRTALVRVSYLEHETT